MISLKRVYLEIINTCDLTCSFCPPSTRKPRIMDLDSFLHHVKSLQGHTKYLYFHVKGEPLLHPRVLEYLEIAHAHGFMVNLSTNGTQIAPLSSGLLTSQGLRQVNFSLHSITGHQGGRGFPQSQDSYLEDIFRFSKLAIVQGIKVELRLWNLNPSLESPSHQGHGPNESILKAIQDFFGLSSSLPQGPSSGKGMTLAPNLFLSVGSEFVWPCLTGPRLGSQGTCLGLRQQIAILVDGTVVPCCLDHQGDIPLGNLMDTSLQTILSSARAQAILGGFQNHQLREALCQTCGYATRFSTKFP